MSGVRFGQTELPEEVAAALSKAKRLEIISIACLAVTVVMVMIVMGSSQAMKAAWIEDCLSFLPPIAFLLALHQVRKPPDATHRFGYHRAIGAGHLAASVALLGMGGFLVVDSGLTLLEREHPTIGTVHLFGHTWWLGWFMIATMIVTTIPTVILGRLKLSVAKSLHDKILFADADMNKADYQTAAGAVLGIVGIGFGWWWTDSVVAILIAVSILRDGWSNLRAALRGLLDRQAMTYDDSELHPLLGAVEDYVRHLAWADDVWVRMRDQGHVLHTEVFVRTHDEVTRAEVTRVTDVIRSLDWKLGDTVVIPVAEFPHVAAEH